MDLKRYLNRLEIPAARPPSRQWLELLHDRHQIQIPFENLDIHAGREIVLDEDAVLDKIVARRRGGFCYELNTAFAWLLRSSGFDVTVLSAEVVGSDGSFGIPFDHMLLEVAVDGAALIADVGFGDGFARPLEIESADEVRQRGTVWRVRSEEGERFFLERYDRRLAAFRCVYRFTREPRQLADFAAACRFHETSPESPFTAEPLCTAAIPDGRVTLHTDRLVLQRGPERREEPIAGEEEWRKALQRYFSLTP